MRRHPVSQSPDGQDIAHIGAQRAQSISNLGGCRADLGLEAFDVVAVNAQHVNHAGDSAPFALCALAASPPGRESGTHA